jgi:hypothetical protein
MVRPNLLVIPTPKRVAVSNNGIRTKGGHVHPLPPGAPVFSVSDHAGIAATIPSMPTTSCQPIDDISFTRTKDPARDRNRNDRYGEGKAKCHTQKRLKMRSIEMAATFFRCGARKASKFHPPCRKTSERNCEANDADHMQHIMMTGGTTVLFKHVTESQIEAPSGKTGDQTPPQSRWSSAGLNLLF